MVDMGVGQQDKVDVPRLDGQRRVFVQVLALLHSEVYQEFRRARFYQRAASRDLVSCA